MSLVYVIEDDQIMADCIALSVHGATETLPDGTESAAPDVLVFNDAVSAMSSIDADSPDVILLDIMLSGPDGFTFLNELVSYHDTARIPVALITSLNLDNRNLDHYGVFRILNKGTMTPADIQTTVLDGIALKASRAGSTDSGLPELAPDEPLVAQIEQFTPQTIADLKNALEAVPLATTPAIVEGETDFAGVVPPEAELETPEADLSPEALAIINGDMSTVMDTALGMPPTNIEANTEPVVLSGLEEFENPAEPIDYLETPGDVDSL